CIVKNTTTDELSILYIRHCIYITQKGNILNFLKISSHWIHFFIAIRINKTYTHLEFSDVVLKSRFYLADISILYD
ncbi:hypothetical protein HZS_7009, partial [Henneguya salminicola]